MKGAPSYIQNWCRLTVLRRCITLYFLTFVKRWRVRFHSVAPPEPLNFSGGVMYSEIFFFNSVTKKKISKKSEQKKSFEDFGPCALSRIFRKKKAVHSRVNYIYTTRTNFNQTPGNFLDKHSQKIPLTNSLNISFCGPRARSYMQKSQNTGHF